jgi:hypothetical protein
LSVGEIFDRPARRRNRFTQWRHFRGTTWQRRFEHRGWKAESAEGIGLSIPAFCSAACR